MKALKSYTIPFVGLKVGEHHFDYQIDNTFFQHFEYDEFNAVDVKIDLKLDKKSTFLELLFYAEGVVNVNCDITNEPYDQAINDEFKLVVKFGNEYNDENEDILIIPHGEYEINIAQYIYELIILAVPIKRVHPGIEDGSLQSDILSKLEELSPSEDTKTKSSEDIDPRWNNLKKLLTDK
ncbi:YceD family protein [Winogradskyella sp. Asnod2-B02-A]|uniref:YceD family protein n=1 Tax=Winogradskyella sp. Asnod2-B02-A TaxID=3160583 RepID=UPI00386539F8